MYVYYSYMYVNICYVPRGREGGVGSIIICQFGEKVRYLRTAPTNTSNHGDGPSCCGNVMCTTGLLLYMYMYMYVHAVLVFF